MFSARFRAAIVEGNEVYIFEEAGHQQPTVKSIPFPNSLITFSYMDMDSAAPLFQKAADAFTALIRTHSEKDSREGLSALNALAERHIFFEPLRQDWRDRISTVRTLDRYTENELRPAALRRLPENLKLIQEQTRRFFSYVLDMDKGGENNPLPVKMAEYLGGSEGSAFQFIPLAMRFELLGQYGPTNVLYPKSIYDLVDYHLRECVNRRVRLRICKHCGHYFPVRGRITAMYCDLTTDQKGHTCKHTGPFGAWAQKNDGELFRAYRLEYKRRFAWIKAGRITADDFYAWSRVSREKRKECSAGKLSLEEYIAWLKAS